MQECYDKPVWTLEELARVLPSIPLHLFKVFPTLFDHPISGKFRERIMLAVAAENRCRYCQTAHSAFGKALGLGDDEISGILEGREEGMDEAEALALAFCRDMARRGFGSRSEDMHERLRERFTDEQIQAVESVARVMNFANRFGNTFDAAMARAAGRCEKTGASLLDLLAVSTAFACTACFAAPVVGALMLYQRLKS